MEVTGIERGDAPGSEGRVRLTAHIRYDKDGFEEPYWFEVESASGAALTDSMNPWLACLAPVAMTLHERLGLPVAPDPVLRANVNELAGIWTDWYPGLGGLDIQAPAPAPEQTPTDRPIPGTTASFFSGGVDSFFTALRHDHGNGGPHSERIDDLIFIVGFDLPLDASHAIETVSRRLRSAAERMGKTLVTVWTNLRTTRFARADWEGVTHGAALASVGLALERRYARVLIGSSAGYRDPRPWGSHPLTDHLLSTSTTTVVHDGPEFMRAEKTEYVTQFDVALDTLRVCWRSSNGENCGRCNNCYRTMLTLDALGRLERCATFDRASLTMEQAARVYCPHSYDVRQFSYVRDLAVRLGRRDIVESVDRSLRGSRRVTRRLAFVRWLRRVPVLWRAVPALEKHVLAGWLV